MFFIITNVHLSQIFMYAYFIGAYIILIVYMFEM